MLKFEASYSPPVNFPLSLINVRSHMVLNPSLAGVYITGSQLSTDGQFVFDTGVYTVNFDLPRPPPLLRSIFPPKAGGGRRGGGFGTGKIFRV